MAARQFQRQLFSLLTRSQTRTSLCTDPSAQILPSVYSLHSRGGFYSRGLQTLVGPSNEALEKAGRNEASSSSAESVSSPVNNDDSSVNASVTMNLKVSPRHDVAMIFTCKVCETRSMKTMCRESYEKGVVVARCGGCNNLHLIADHLGWFGEPGSIEDLLAARGEEVKKGSADTLNITLEDLAGKANLKI